MLNYKSKYIKYKNKYLNLLKGGFKNKDIDKEQEAETSNYQTKYIKAHGSIVAGETFLLPEGCNVITLTDIDINIYALPEYDAIIKYHLYQNDELFLDNNLTYIKTDKCKILENYLNYYTNLRKKTGLKTFNIRNHVGPMTMNEMYLNFSEDPCDEFRCSIDLYNPQLSPYVRIQENVKLNWLAKNGNERKNLNSYFLSDLIEKEGSGTYIIKSCRGISSSLPQAAALARQISDLATNSAEGIPVTSTSNGTPAS